MHRILVVFLIAALTLSSCNFDCGIDDVSNGFAYCRNVKTSLTKTQIAGFGACGAATNSRKIEISCSANSGTHSACTSRSDRSGYFVVLVPNSSNGQFVDSNYSTTLGHGPIKNCETLWGAMSAPSGSGVSDVTAVYHGDPTTSDSVTCSDTNGCHVVSANCFSGWDSHIGQASGLTASIENGNFLACAFIDSPYLDATPSQGTPPLTGLPAGLIASSAPSTFSSVQLKNPTTAPIQMNTWVDYQDGTDACSSTTNSRKIKLSCSPSSGTQGTCKLKSNKSGYFSVVVPNNNGGSFIDTNYSTALGNGPITNCDTLWTAMNAASGSRPTDIIAYYHGDPAAGDSVTCNDSSGCTLNSSKSCYSSWDSNLQAPSGQPAVIANGSYLSCTFIDSGYADGVTPPQGSPPSPSVGLIGSSGANSLGTAIFTSGNPLDITTWTDY